MKIAVKKRFAPICDCCGYELPLLWETEHEMRHALALIECLPHGRYVCIKCKNRNGR